MSQRTVHDLRRQSGLFAHRLANGGEKPLAHLGVAGLDIQTPAFQHADRGVSAIDGAVADAGALDAAADAGVLGALVNVLDGFELRRSPATLSRMIWPVAKASPGFRMLRSRMS